MGIAQSIEFTVLLNLNKQYLIEFRRAKARISEIIMPMSVGGPQNIVSVRAGWNLFLDGVKSKLTEMSLSSLSSLVH